MTDILLSAEQTTIYMTEQQLEKSFFIFHFFVQRAALMYFHCQQKRDTLHCSFLGLPWFILSLSTPIAANSFHWFFKYQRQKQLEFANSLDFDEVAHYEPPHQDLHCLPFCPFVLEFSVWYSLDLIFLKIWRRILFKMELLLLKENNCTKLFWNPYINVKVMVRTSSIYDRFIIWPSSVTLTFNLPEQMFEMTLLLLKENNGGKLFLKFMLKCRN